MKHANKMENSEWISTKQAMEYLLITSRTTLYEHLRNGSIRVAKPLNGKVYINLSDLRAYLNNMAIKLS
jgi:excisionase family DNA binding protein